jgi:hypothetical protein
MKTFLIEDIELSSDKTRVECSWWTKKDNRIDGSGFGFYLVESPKTNKMLEPMRRQISLSLEKTRADFI